jgi:hypothetical protein
LLSEKKLKKFLRIALAEMALEVALVVLAAVAWVAAEDRIIFVILEAIGCENLVMRFLDASDPRMIGKIITSF